MNDIFSCQWWRVTNAQLSLMAQPTSEFPFRLVMCTLPWPNDVIMSDLKHAPIRQFRFGQ